MDVPMLMEPARVDDDTTALGAYLPLPGLGALPVYAYLVRAREPVLIDTGLVHLKDRFVEAVRRTLPLEELRWIYLTHADPDHLGALDDVLAGAPEAKVITTYLGMGKLGLLARLPPLDRIRLLNPGERLDAGDRTFLAVKPPTYDAPETVGLLDERTRNLFCADAFGTVTEGPVADPAVLTPDSMRHGLGLWATVDAPWLAELAPERFRARLDEVRGLSPAAICSAHLPPARGMTERLLGILATVPKLPPFLGPSQAQLSKLLGTSP